MAKIEIIQGDNYEAELEIKGLEDLTFIDKIYFSCSMLSLKKEIALNDDGIFVLKLSNTETEDLMPCTTTYDITIKFVDSKIQTAVYRDIFVVKNKTNPIN